MSGNLTATDVLAKLGIAKDDGAAATIESAGILPQSVKNANILQDMWVFGAQPKDFVKDFSSQSLDFNDLMAQFKECCKDFNDVIQATTPSKALEFSSRILFEYGPIFRSEKKSKGDKAIKFKFPYKKTPEIVKEGPGPPPAPVLSVKVVIVSTFKDASMPQKQKVEDDKLVITMKQATLLSMVTFLKVCEYAYGDGANILMTPLCGAIFSKDSITKLETGMKKPAIEIIKMINASTAPHGQHLPDSDMACAIVATIAGTRGMSSKGGRDQLIAKVIKQYAAASKNYNSDNFKNLAEHALGGVPPGLDPATLVDNFNNIQMSARQRK